MAGDGKVAGPHQVVRGECYGVSPNLEPDQGRGEQDHAEVVRGDTVVHGSAGRTD